MKTYHLLKYKRAFTAVCGYFFENGEDYKNHAISIWCAEEQQWLDEEPLTCEICILLNFQNPNDTSHCKCDDCVYNYY